MKRGLVLAAVCAGLLASCNPVQTNEQATTPTKAADAVEAPYGMNVWTDPATGCQYFVPYYNTQYGIMPRTSADGFHQLCSESIIVSMVEPTP